MAGLFGVVGETSVLIPDVGKSITYHAGEKTAQYQDDSVHIRYSDHRVDYSDQPAEAKSDGTRFWCWGEVLGEDCEGPYRPRNDTLTDAAYCARLYDKYGIDFIGGLNSEFAGVIYQSDQEMVYLFTDRLSSRPLYYTKTVNGDIVFSTLIPSLSDHPEISLKFDSECLLEFFHTTRVFGVNTPVKGVKQCPPGSRIAIDLEGNIVGIDQYWQPSIQTSDKSFSQLVKEFQKLLRAAVVERLPEEGTTGLLLSGGSDSRLILGEIDGPTTAFHLNERLSGNEEAETAQQIAEVGGANFSFLQRDIDYYPSVLEASIPITNFNGVFRHSHALGFQDEIRGQCDVLFSGQYSDSLFSGFYTPQRYRKSMIRHFLPTDPVIEINNTNKFINTLPQLGDFTEKIPFLNSNRWKPSISFPDDSESNNIVVSDIVYPNVSFFTNYGMIYPLTNVYTFNFYESNSQITPVKYPFLDNRVVDLAFYIPSEYKLKKDIVASTLKQNYPELAAIPHPKYGVSLNRSSCVRHYTGKAKAAQKIFKRKLSWDDSNNDPLVWDGPWADHNSLIRNHSFISEILSEHEAKMNQSTFIDTDSAFSMLNAHLNGESHREELYCLAMVLSSNIRLPGVIK